jgi:hypothetical protein
MSWMRTILAFLIALSVALLPVAGSAAFKLTSHDMTETSANEPMHDCCPDKANPCDKAVDCASMAACTSNCLSFAGGGSSPFIYLVSIAAILPPMENAVLRSRTGTPPFRPPRV